MRTNVNAHHALSVPEAVKRQVRWSDDRAEAKFESKYAQATMRIRGEKAFKFITEDGDPFWATKSKLYFADDMPN